MLQSTRKIKNMPATLMINTSVAGPDVKQLWATPNWLPSEIGIIVDQGLVYCYQDQDLRLHVQRGVYNIQVYELVGVVCEINSAEGQKPHLVSMVNGTWDS
jgi:PAB-dependent poly(A)-specific ribonuclease subunit 2